MKQAYMPEPRAIRYRDVPRPTLEPGSLLLKVERIAICGSDVHVYVGKHPLVSFPLVQGHEFSGTVVEVGAKVSGYAAGDLVAIQPAVGCGTCDRCRDGFIARCDNLMFIGGALPGGGSDYFLVDASQVIKMPPGITRDEAALVEPSAVAVHAASRPALASQTPVEKDRVLIMGGGTIGNLIAQTLRALGTTRIVVSERIDFRRQILESMGFSTVAPGEGTAFERRVANVLGDRPSVVFECAGNAGALNESIRSVVRGGTVVVVGVYEEPPKTEMVLVQDKELTLVGSLMYTWDDYRQAVGLIEKHAIDVGRLISRHIPFDRWEEGYRLLLERPNEVLKVVVDL